MKAKRKNELDSYIAANRKGSRNANLENATGFVSMHKVHPSKKSYNRKNYKVPVE